MCHIERKTTAFNFVYLFWSLLFRRWTYRPYLLTLIVGLSLVRLLKLWPFNRLGLCLWFSQRESVGIVDGLTGGWWKREPRKKWTRGEKRSFFLLLSAASLDCVVCGFRLGPRGRPPPPPPSSPSRRTNSSSSSRRDLQRRKRMFVLYWLVFPQSSRRERIPTYFLAFFLRANFIWRPCSVSSRKCWIFSSGYRHRSNPFSRAIDDGLESTLFSLNLNLIILSLGRLFMRQSIYESLLTNSLTHAHTHKLNRKRIK